MTSWALEMVMVLKWLFGDGAHILRSYTSIVEGIEVPISAHCMWHSGVSFYHISASSSIEK